MESKTEILNRLGKKDGFDEQRWVTACNISEEKDIHVNFCFESLISLEEKDLIQINSVSFIELLSNNITYLAYPCKKCKIGYERLDSISKEELIKSKTFKVIYTDESGFLNDDVVIYNENNLGFVVTEKEINEKHKTYLSAKGIERKKRLLKDILLDKIVNIHNKKKTDEKE